MGVRRIDDGKYARVVDAVPDPLKITCRRRAKKSDGSRAAEPRDVAKPRSKSRVKLLKCVSMWKNQTSQIVPLETRVVHNRFNSILPQVDMASFEELKSSLDREERLHLRSETGRAEAQKEAAQEKHIKR